MSRLWLLVLFFLFVPSVQAATMVITCTRTECESTTEGDAFFQETSFIPGETSQKTVIVLNKGQTECLVTARMPSDTLKNELHDRLKITVTSLDKDEKKTATIGSNSITLDTIHPGKEQTFSWVASFDSFAENEYQNKSTSFDIVQEIICGEEGKRTIEHTQILGRSQASVLNQTESLLPSKNVYLSIISIFTVLFLILYWKLK